MVAWTRRQIWKGALLTALILGFTSSALAQLADGLIQTRLFGGVGEGSQSTQALAGGGLDVNLKPAFGIAMDADVWLRQGGAGLGTILVGGLYRFNPSRTTVPYLRAGFAGAIAALDFTHGLHAGAGIDHRINERVGLQAEGLLLTTSNSHFELRLGVVLR